MEVHDDHLSPSDVQEVSHVFDDRGQGGDPNDVVIDPEPAHVVTFLGDRGAIRDRRIITYPDIQVPYAVH